MKYIRIEFSHGSSVIGFGVYPKTLDPKILKSTYSRNEINTIDCKVKVFSLTSCAWRGISNNMHLSVKKYYI
jgi:hypothetical protein